LTGQLESLYEVSAVRSPAGVASQAAV